MPGRGSGLGAAEEGVGLRVIQPWRPNKLFVCWVRGIQLLIPSDLFNTFRFCFPPPYHWLQLLGADEEAAVIEASPQERISSPLSPAGI